MQAVRKLSLSFGICSMIVKKHYQLSTLDANLAILVASKAALLAAPFVVELLERTDFLSLSIKLREVDKAEWFVQQ